MTAMRALMRPILALSLVLAVGLDVTGSVTLTAGLYSYSEVHIYPGGTLAIDASSGNAVTLTVGGAFTWTRAA